jgi:hypothetical protein
MQWLQYMLPGANCMGISNLKNITSGDCADGIRYQAILRPISATDNVSCSGGGYTDGRAVVRRGCAVTVVAHLLKIRPLIALYDKFRTRLARAVRVMTSQPVYFAITP